MQVHKRTYLLPKGLLVAVISAALVSLGAPVAPASARPMLGGTWGSAEEVPNTASLNAGGSAATASESCASAGDCSAGGYYMDDSGNVQSWVATETSGTWGHAQEDAASLNAGGDSGITSVSCSSAGNCTAAGWYTNSSGDQEAYATTETNGTWDSGTEVGQSLNLGGYGGLNTVSCSSPGNCTAAGYYTNSSGGTDVFGVTQTNGAWGTAKTLASELNAGDDGAALSVSCSSAGNCVAGGTYADSSHGMQAFIVSEASGAWGSAAEKGSILNNGGIAMITSVSCADGEDCEAAGSYIDSNNDEQVFTVTEASGSWADSAELPGSSALNAGGGAEINSISCPSAGNCTVGGGYTDSSGNLQAFVDDESSGTWGSAQEMPGTATLNASGDAALTAVSCASAGNCGAGGYYSDSSGNSQAFVGDESGSTWDSAQEVAGTLNNGGIGGVNAISCPSAGHCGASGLYEDSSDNLQAFVTDELTGNKFRVPPNATPPLPVPHGHAICRRTVELGSLPAGLLNSKYRRDSKYRRAVHQYTRFNPFMQRLFSIYSPLGGPRLTPNC